MLHSDTIFFSAMPRYSSLASASQFAQRPTTLRAYSHSMYQYTNSQMTVLPASSTTVLMPNQTSAPSRVYSDQSLGKEWGVNVGYDKECEE
ncbi:hypothetical protein AUP68_14051 [Ilyonectria robusta]|nr:hypothetical protein EDB80DRAFT_739209 [Ilyonectria destructans]KAH6976831.1 hypothetical protein EDB80DRAFT_738803 [Ilyonectria destructans]